MMQSELNPRRYRYISKLVLASESSYKRRYGANKEKLMITLMKYLQMMPTNMKEQVIQPSHFIEKQMIFHQDI